MGLAQSSRNVGTLPWMSPEPFADAENQEQIVIWVMRGEKDVIPDDCPAALAGCWQEHTQRPRIEEASSASWGGSIQYSALSSSGTSKWAKIFIVLGAC